MSYIERIIDNNLFPEDDDHIVKHDAQLYLSLNNNVYIPLADVGGQLTVDTGSQIRYDKTVDMEKIDELESHISGMKGSIAVQADLPDNIPNVELPMADDDGDTDTDAEDDAGDDADAGDTDSDAGDAPFNIEDLLTDDEDGEKDNNADEFDFGLGKVVQIDDEAGIDYEEAGQELDELEYGIAGMASKVVYQTYDPTTITDLIKERHQIVDPIILEKLKHLIQTMVANYIRQSKQTPGERLLHEGLPSWIVPVSCVKLILVDQEVFFNAPAENVGCNTEFDIPYKLQAYVDRMITDREDEVPGAWFQARRDYGVNMVYLTNGCNIDGPLNMRRYPITAYNYRINLTQSHRDQIDEKREQARSKTQERGRLRCGAAYARAVTEPGAIESISITKSTGARTNTKVVAIAVYNINDLTEEPQLVSLKCANGQGFTKALDEIIQSILGHTLTDEVFQKCHNFKPIARALKMFNMDIFSIGPKMLNRISAILNANHPKLNYRHCRVCQTYLLYGKEETKCKTCDTDTTEADWSDVHNQIMRKNGQELHTNMHPKRASIDYGRLHYQDRLFKYIKDHPNGRRPVSPPNPESISAGLNLVSPRAVQLIDGHLYYKVNDKFYKAKDYKILIENQQQDMYLSHVRNYPSDYESIEQQRKLLELAYGHREAQIERANRKLLSGLVINIVKNVPQSDVIVRYLNRILEMDGNDSIYLSMIKQFEELGVIAYDERNGRYVVAKNNEMIICICHKTYIENGHTFNGDESFIDDGQCRYCRTVLHDIEQMGDPTNLTGRELIAGNIEEATDDTYIYLETLLNVVLDHMSEEIESQGWIITSSNREAVLEMLKLDTSITVDPYGRNGTTHSINKSSGDIRALVLDIDARDQADQRRIYVKGKKKSQYGYNLETKQVYKSDKTLNFKALISAYLYTTLMGTQKLVNDLLSPKAESPLAGELDSVLRDMSKSPNSGRGTSNDVLENEHFIFAYYNLPIVNTLSRNISIILGYVSNFLETKYGIKEMVGGKPIYLNNNRQEIAEMIKIKLDLKMEFIHEIIRKYTSIIDNKYLTTVSMLGAMGQPDKVTYFDKMRNLFRYHGSNVFNPRFTLYFSSLFQNGSSDFNTELKKLMDNTLWERRKIDASIYDAMQEGKKPMVRERQIAMWYDIASPDVVSSVPGSGRTDSIDDYQACKESAQQRTYTGYIEQLRTGYEAASEKAKEITSLEEVAVAADGSNIDILTTTGYLAQSQKLLDEPKEDVVPQWKEAMMDARANYQLKLTSPETDRCEFMPEDFQNIIRRGQLIVDHAFHTTLIPIHQGRYDVGELVDRSMIDLGLRLDDQENETWIRLTNLRAAEQNGLSQYSFGGLFSDEEGAVIDDNNANIRKNYVSGTIPDKSRISIVDTHNERAHKSKQMRRVVKLQTEHKLIPEFLRGDDDMDVFKPWGGWDDEQRETAAITEDLVIRRIRRVQNIGMSLIKILRWLGRTMTQMEMEVMGSYIKLARDGNVIGADMEFNTTRDQIDGMGYILKDLYDLKLELIKDDDAGSYHLANYESHFEEFYQMSYWEYSTYVQNMDPDNAVEWDNKTYMLDLVYLSIVSDLFKHIRSIGADGQAVNDPLASINMEQLPDLRLRPNKGFIKVVAQVLNALIKHAGPEILDPDRSDIDWRYEERFMEYASKRKVVTARSIKKQSGLNINTPYIGQPTSVSYEFDEGDDDAEDPMDMVAAPDDYEVEGEDRPRKDGAREDDDDDYELEDEILDGMENTAQGEIED
jgi:hypothetical protein